MTNKVNFSKTILALALCILALGARAAAFFDDFESYAVGSNLHGQGGWTGWSNNPNAGAFVSTNFAFSPTRSVNITGASDLVHTFSGATNGQWVFSVMQYIPSTSTGTNYVVLLNTYRPPYGSSDLNWSAQIQNNMDTGQIISDFGGGTTLPMVKDQWVEVRCEINLVSNSVSEFYNGQLLSTHAWQGGLGGPGLNEIQALDLFANNAGPVYYDNVSLDLFQSYTIPITVGLNLIANQLDHGSNTLNEIMPSVPDASVLYKYNNTGSNWTASAYNAATGRWVPGNLTLNPGEGAFFQSPTNFSLIVTGTPHVPVLPVTIPSGAIYLLSRMTNDIGNYTNIVGVTPSNGATVYRWSGSTYNSYSFASGAWIPSEPAAAVGEAVWISTPGGGQPPPIRQSLVYQGLTNTSLGNATLSVSSNQLTVGNLGSNGQDGVEIEFPTNLSGWGVNWLALDPSNALPVGAYLQEQIIGAFGSVSNGLLATLTTTKAGTSNYVMTADYTPIGLSNLLLQAYNGTDLAGQTNLTGGPKFLLSNSGSLEEDWEWQSDKMMMKHTWWTPPPLPPRFSAADTLAMIPQGISGLVVSAARITASGIASITITNENESVVYQGLANTSLGNASISVDLTPLGGPTLEVSNLGSSGQDGVSIAFPTNLTDLEVGWQDLDVSNTLPVGAYIQSQTIGTANGITNGVLDTLTVTKQCAVCDGSNYVVSADFSPIGASNYTVQAYLHGVLVAQAIASNGAPLTVCPIKIKPDVDWKKGVPTASIIIIFGVATSAFAGGPVVTWDSFDLTPNGNAPLGSPPTAFQIVASQVPGLTITSENVSLVYQGLANTSLGNAALAVSGSELVVSNLGSSGQDGVSIALNPGNSFAVGWQDLDPSDALPAGAYVESQLIGTAGAVTNGVLGSTTCTKAGTSNYVITVDYTPLGSSTHTVQVYNGTNLVAQVTGQSGSLVATTRLPPGTCTINPELNQEWPHPTYIEISGGPAVMGTEILMIPEASSICCIIITNGTAEQILAAYIPSITITSEVENPGGIANLVYQGLTNRGLGFGTLAVSGTELVVSNLGSSGQDGVAIALPANLTALEVEWQPLDPSNSLPVGAYVQEQIIGTAGAITNGLLGTVTATKTGTSNYVVSADYTPLGASAYTVQAYRNEVLVAQATNQPGASLAILNLPPQSGDMEPTPSCTCTMDWPPGGPWPLLTIAGLASVQCDHLYITPENVSGTPTAFQITASQVPGLTITSENVSLIYQGLTNTSLGTAALSVSGSSMIVTNLGSSGQDGVAIALPSNLSGLDVGWQALDDSDTLPVGAYIQEQIIGTAGAITNGLWGTLTMTKQGTSNYVVSANYAPLGASTYTVQAFLKGALVGQTTNQPGASLAVCGGCGTSYDWEFWPRFGPTMDWGGGGTPILLGGAALTCDRLYIVPENVAITGTPTAMQITASQVPALTITSENLSTVFQGLTNTSAGSAIIANQLDHGSNTADLVISNIGSSGQDGVSIAMANNLTALEVHWLNPDPSNSLPVGAYVQEQMIGTAGTVGNGVLGTVTVTKTGAAPYPYVVSADYSAIGASTYTVQAYRNKVLVAQATGQDGASLAQAGGCSLSFDWEIWPDFGPTTDWGSGGTPLLLGTASVVCDQLYIIPENVSWSSRPTAMQITASQVPALTITSENVSMVYDGLTNTSLGNASLVYWGFRVSSNQLVVSNLGSSGQDGVEVALNPGNNFAASWLALDPSNALPVGAYVESQFIGGGATVTNGVLGSVTCTKGGTSNYLITVDYSPLGSSTHTVQVYNGATLVAQLSGQLGAACAIVKLPPGTCTINPWLNQEWPNPTDITLVGGPTVTGTEILVIPEGGTAVSSVSAARILTANIPSFILTNESVSLTYAGLPHAALGTALIANQLDHGSNWLVVSNLGSSGQDGVSIALPSNLTHWDAHWLNPEASQTLPVGAYIKQQIIGTAGAVSNGVLETVQVTKAGTSNYVISADFSPIGASTRTVEVYNGANLVARVTGQSGPVCAISVSISASASAGAGCCPFYAYVDVDFGVSVSLAISGGPNVVGDRLVVIPEGGSSVSFPVTMQITASQIPSLTITSEDVTLTYAGLSSTALGNASISSAFGPLTVANLGSSGQDGVSFALPSNLPGLDIVWSPALSNNALPVGAYIRQQIVGTANGVNNGVLGTMTMTKQCAVCNGSNWVVSADFSPVGATTYTVQAYRNGVLVAQATGQPGGSLATCPIYGDSGCIPQPPILKGGWDWPDPGPFVNIAGSAPVQADHLFITPENVPGSSTLTALQLTASQVPSLSITAVTVSPLLVSLSQTPQHVTLQWFGTGVLQTSTDLKTWTDLSTAVSPYVIPTVSANRGFYRIRQPIGN